MVEGCNWELKLVGELFDLAFSILLALWTCIEQYVP